MEINKEEAERARDMAKKFLAKREYDKAIRFFEKSNRMYPLVGVPQLIERAKKEMAEANAPKASGPSAARQAAERRTSTSQAGAPPGATTANPAGRPFTPEQVAAVKRVKACGGDHYKVLGTYACKRLHTLPRPFPPASLPSHNDPLPPGPQTFRNRPRMPRLRRPTAGWR